MNKTPASLLCDFYKISHRPQYPSGTQIIYSTWTPRSNKHYPPCDKAVVFGPQGFSKKYLIDYFNDNFFDRPVTEVVDEYRRVIQYALGVSNPDAQHIIDLHELGYLPVEVNALAEGTRVPMRVPVLTIHNTDPRFFWVTNYLETLISCEMWGPSTSATIADRYRRILDKYALETAGSTDFVPFQGHDFSFRGMFGLEAAILSGAGHLTSFVGTDTIPAIPYLEHYYNANIEKELVGTSIPATEHSVMCAGGDGEGEYETYKRLITEVYPNGFISIVSDTWDLWNTITDILPRLKDQIMSRDGKVVIRPDSGDPVKIVCGDPDANEERRYKGVVELLWEIFGGTINELGYRELDPHIGCIYGDAITPERCSEICNILKLKGFASTNMVYGIGSYTYQYNTRDTFGYAMKSTMCKINGSGKKIYKDPVTDDGTKKSQTGCVVVQEVNGELVVIDGLDFDHKICNRMRSIFKNGQLLVDDTLSDIRARLR
jgi:nicotinamide phosphoribosyltransferase